MEDLLMFSVNVCMLKNMELRPQALSFCGPLVTLGYAVKASEKHRAGAWSIQNLSGRTQTRNKGNFKLLWCSDQHRGGTLEGWCTEIIIELPHCQRQCWSLMKKYQALLTLYSSSTQKQHKTSERCFGFFSSSFLKQIPCEAAAATVVSFTTLSSPCHWVDRAIYQLFIWNNNRAPH